MSKRRTLSEDPNTYAVPHSTHIDISPYENNIAMPQYYAHKHTDRKKRIMVLALVTALFVLFLLMASSSSSSAPHKEDRKNAAVLPPETTPASLQRPTTNDFYKQFMTPDEQALYGYDGYIDSLRALEFPQLNATEHGVYLDYMGSGQYQKTQLERVMNDFAKNLYGNAHSPNDCSLKTEEKVDQVRKAILKYFNTNSDEYLLVFTSGATGGLRMLGENFPFSKDSTFVLLNNNHNSVIGIREYALERGGKFYGVSEAQLGSEAAKILAENGITDEKTDYTCNEYAQYFDALNADFTLQCPSGSAAHNLLAIPAQDNFDGAKYPYAAWTKAAHLARGGCWKVLLDASALVPTAPLDLGAMVRMDPSGLSAPDFVVMSFYKMMGYPTGLGALLIRKDAVPMMNHLYWGGGQVRIALPNSHYHLDAVHQNELFEAGTISFLDIISVGYGLDALNEVGGAQKIRDHTWSLVHYMYRELDSARHSNGKRVFEIYGKHTFNDPERQGSIVAFNVLKNDGSYIGYANVLSDANDEKFFVRTGCMCNPGTCYSSVGLTIAEILNFAKDYEQETCYNDVRIRGKPVGAVRVSVGYPTSFEDVHSFVQFAKKYYVN